MRTFANSRRGGRHSASSYKSFRTACLGSAGLAVVVFAASSARANITIVPTFDSTITNDPHATQIEATINQAIGFYEANITTPTTVTVTYAEMTSGLGQSSTYINSTSYSSFRSALASHSSGDATDTSALASLPTGSANPVNGGSTVTASLPLLRAVGFTGGGVTPPTGQTDSTVSINTSITNYTGVPYNPSNYSLLAVVEHETDEVLGTGSQLDSGTTTGAISPEDLFRYAGSGVRSFSLSTSATAYLSVNGGATNLINFNQSGPPGGADYGDWASSGTPHVQDAFGTPGASPVYGVEATALDAIGYNYVAAPEPASIGLLSIAAFGLLSRRRSRR